MNDGHDQAMIEQRVFRYLYDDLAPEERRRFELDLEDNPALQTALDQQRQLDEMLPRGLGPLLDEQRLQDNFAAAMGRIRRQSTPVSSWSDLLAAMVRSPVWLSAQALGLGLAFGLGMMLDTPATSPQSGSLASLSPLDLVKDEDYEIYQMEVNSFDAATGAIDLSFSLASNSRFVGNVADAGVQALINVALRDDVDDEARLKSVELLQYAGLETDGQGEATPPGLLHALANDINPGVRYSAATSLVSYADDEQVRDVFRQALLEDTNPGVRMVAFETLADQPDTATLDVFRQKMVADSNDYIRNRARSIVDNLDDSGHPGLF